jgi:hypothetical protein
MCSHLACHEEAEANATPGRSGFCPRWVIAIAYLQSVSPSIRLGPAFELVRTDSPRGVSVRSGRSEPTPLMSRRQVMSRRTMLVIVIVLVVSFLLMA